MLTMTGVCALVAVSVLFFILGYLVYNGGRSINWDFFTKLPKPVGETGGGMANAIVGSAKLLLLASLIGAPIGFLGAIYLAEFSGSKVAFVVRYAADLLNGVPSIVIGIFAFSLAVLPFKHFSTLAGGFALGLMMIPITLRSTEEFLLAVPRALREAAMALGASKSKTTSGNDFQICCRTVRRLESASLGGRAGAAGIDFSYQYRSAGDTGSRYRGSEGVICMHP